MEGKLASGSTRVSGWIMRQGFARSSRAVCLEGFIVKSALDETGEVEDAAKAGFVGRDCSVGGVADVKRDWLDRSLEGAAACVFWIARLARHSTKFPVRSSGESSAGILIGVLHSAQRTILPVRLAGMRIWQLLGQWTSSGIESMNRADVNDREVVVHNLTRTGLYCLVILPQCNMNIRRRNGFANDRNLYQRRKIKF